MPYKIWAGLAQTQAQYVSMKPRWTPKVCHLLDDALWYAMKINDAGRETVWEIEGDDGSRMGQQEVAEMVQNRKHALRPPKKF
jgi:hypothetical protein